MSRVLRAWCTALDGAGERNIYTLVGNAGEPLAEGHFTMACRARQPAVHKLMVPNVLRDGKAAAKYRVMTDLDCVGGEDSLVVEPCGSAPYSVQVCGGQAGTMKGTITFIADSGMSHICCVHDGSQVVHALVKHLSASSGSARLAGRLQSSSSGAAEPFGPRPG